MIPLDRFNLTIAAGELVVVLGSSGAGKSTLLNVIAGFLRPNAERVHSRGFLRRLVATDSMVSVSGQILIRGDDVSYLEPRERDIGLVMQKFSLYNHWTVRDNLEFPLRMSGVPKEKRLPRILEVVNILGIDRSDLDERPQKLAGGEQQRVAIGKMLLRNPYVGLFDEAFSHLDWKLRDRLRMHVIEDFLKREKNDQRRAVVFVSHNLEDAERAEKIVYFEGPPANYRKAPRITTCEIYAADGAKTAWQQFQSAHRVHVTKLIALDRTEMP